jgi:hypothetical protein
MNLMTHARWLESAKREEGVGRLLERPTPSLRFKGRGPRREARTGTPQRCAVKHKVGK